MNPWAAAAQAAAKAQRDDQPAYRLHPRTELFTCKACQVQERATLPNYYTAWTCWFCGDDTETLPRPTAEPAVAKK